MKSIFSILFFLVFLSPAAIGQLSIEQLQRQITDAEADIRATNTLLSKTESDRKDNRSLLQLVLKNIGNRKQIISSLDSQIGLINRSVNAKSGEISRMEQELKELKTEYAAMVRAAYKSQQSNNMLAFLFASEDFNDMTQRIFYIKRYTAIRERKAEQIDSVSQVMRTDVAALAVKRDSLNNTVNLRNSELQKLGKEEQDYRRIDTSLSSQARQYNQKIAEQQRLIKNAQDQIQRIIAEEARKSQSTPQSAAEKEEFIKLTGRFDENKGKLPYPVSGGVVIDKFGLHTDPDNPKVKRNQKGVVIATERGAPVRAVFDGNVHAITFLAGLSNTVIIRHGNYFTSYSNLETVSVKVGDKVSTNQNIGKIYSGPNTEYYILPFTISDITKSLFLNPEQWIKR